MSSKPSGVFAAGEDALIAEHGGRVCGKCKDVVALITPEGLCHRCATGDTQEKIGAIYSELVYRRRFVFERKLWTCADQSGYNGAAWWNGKRRLKVLETVGTHFNDRRVWHHVSVSVPSSDGAALPSWTDLAYVKEQFIGSDREAYVVFPPRDRYVNIKNVLHLWACMDVERGEVLPSFEAELIDGAKSI